jgi:hypothetical protein
MLGKTKNQEEIILSTSVVIGGTVGILAHTVVGASTETSWLVGIVTTIGSMITLVLKSKRGEKSPQISDQIENIAEPTHEITLKSLTPEERIILREAINKASN